MPYEYKYDHAEANFGPPIQTEVPGGAHLTFDVVLHHDRAIYALRRPEGLHDGPMNALYFPHGLIRFGETVETCVARLVRDQAGVAVRDVRVHSLSSWVEDSHWHLCLNVLAEVAAIPQTTSEVSEVVRVTPSAIPEEWAWWSADAARKMLLYIDYMQAAPS